jgi:flagellum-specific ATP synthase
MSHLALDERTYNDRIAKMLLYRERGKLSKSVGLTFEGYLPGAAVGSIVRMVPSSNQDVHGANHGSNHGSIEAEVIGFKDKRVILMPFEEGRGLNNTAKIILSETEAAIDVGDFLLGRVIGAKGEPIDDKGPFFTKAGARKAAIRRSIYGEPVNPLDRNVISEPLDLGIRAINGLLTCGKGQRLGIMAGSGVGKSVLLGMMARQTKADVNVIALVGERGREVREFIERDLGEEGLARSVVVCATSEKSPLLRMRCAFVATAVAEYFRDKGKDVLLMMDSVTRFCMAQREIGLSLGEPPASKGYTPSVFSLLPKLIERAGTRKGKGSITALYTVLVEGDDMDEPVADAARSVLDGHIVLARRLAARNHYPAIDVAASVSRVMRSVVEPVHREAAGEIRELMAIYSAHEDLINIGAYVKGSNPKLDRAMVVIDRINAFLRQAVEEKGTIRDCVLQLQGILRAAQ